MACLATTARKGGRDRSSANKTLKSKNLNPNRPAALYEGGNTKPENVREAIKEIMKDFEYEYN